MKIMKLIFFGIILVVLGFELVKYLEKPIHYDDERYQQEDPVIVKAEPYLNKIVFEDIELRSLASSNTQKCSSGNKECQLNEIFRYVVDNYDYYTDPRSGEYIQSPEDTIKVMGGDCEDLTILMISLLENLGFKTYLVLTDNHAYALACGVDTTELWVYAKQSIIEIAALDLGESSEYDVEIKSGTLFLKKEIEQTMALDSGDIWYYGGDGSSFKEPIQYMDIGYSISSSAPLDIYFVPSNEEQSKIANKESFSHYPSCHKQSILQVTDSCDSFDKRGGIILINADSENRATVNINLEYFYAYSTQNVFSGQNISYYTIDGEKCVVLEATSGKYGFPGYDSTDGEKIAVDSVTKEYMHLS